MLRASARIAVPGSQDLLRRLCDHFAEHCEVELEGDRGRFLLGYGTAVLQATPEGIEVAAEAGDEVYLSYVKMGVAEHVIEMAEGPSPSIRWQGDGAGLTTPPFLREMRVVDAWQVAPRMRRVRLAGADLSRFATGGLHVRLLFPPAGRAPRWPTMGEDGRIRWPDGADKFQTRVYTLRRVDPAAGFVDIDVVLHEGEETPGSRFALHAGAGDVVGMTGPGGGDVPNAKTLLLVGDDTALPAIARILEALPEDGRARVIAEVDGPGDEPAFASKGRVEVSFLHRAGAPVGTCGLLTDAVRELDFAMLGEGLFVWVGAEFSDFRDIRAHLRKERRMARRDHLAVAYWRRDHAGDDAHADD